MNSIIVHALSQQPPAVSMQQTCRSVPRLLKVCSNGRLFGIHVDEGIFSIKIHLTIIDPLSTRPRTIICQPYEFKCGINLCFRVKRVCSLFSAVCSPVAFLANSWLALAVEDSDNRGFFCGVLIQVNSFWISTFHPSSLSSTCHSGSVHHCLCVHDGHALQHVFPSFLCPLPRLRSG